MSTPSKIAIRKKYVPSGLSIYYEDHEIIVIEKECGLLSVPANYEKDKNALNLLTQYVRKGSTRSKLELHAVNRLDRETSGVMVFAKNRQLREKMHEDWGRAKKIYHALVKGQMKEKSGEMKAYLQDGEDYVVRSVENDSGGKLAITQYRVVKESANDTLLELKLVTGKKNQIRVHLADLGMPIVGDKKYGSKNKGRMCLHATSIKFPHPKTNEEMFFESPIPALFLAPFKETDAR